MSEQNNTSFAHAFLPGLILGLIIGAVAGAFVPDMLGGPKIKISPTNTSAPNYERDTEPEIDAETQAIIDQAEKDAAEKAANAAKAAEDAIDDAIDATEAAEETIDNAIDDATNNLPSQP